MFYSHAFKVLLSTGKLFHVGLSGRWNHTFGKEHKSKSQKTHMKLFLQNKHFNEKFYLYHQNSEIGKVEVLEKSQVSIMLLLKLSRGLQGLWSP